MKREDFDALAVKHKQFEKSWVDRDLMAGVPYVARLDGRAFHTFTRGLKRPYDEAECFIMNETTKFLVSDTHASIGYTQSDEISLVFVNDKPGMEMPFGGNIQKLVSLMAASASVYFNKILPKHLPEKARFMPTLDCRVYSYPNLDLVYEYLLWREADATRNSLTMAAQSLYSTKELHGVGFKGKHDLLHAKGVNWNDYPAAFKRGTYIRRETYEALLSDEELARIPEKHRPKHPVIRSHSTIVDMPPISRLHHPIDTLFYGASPETSPFVLSGK